MKAKKKLATVAPAVLMTLVSMVLTLAVALLWLGESMPWYVALVVGLGLDGGWLATLAYERRLAAQGDHSRPVTLMGWLFGLLATGLLVAHALGEDSPAPWLAVAWLPLAAKALWLIHGLWERTSLTPHAIATIQTVLQDSRDHAAVARAQLRADATHEVTRVTAVTAAGARVARIQAKAAGQLSEAWEVLREAQRGDNTAHALTSVTSGVTPASQGASRPVWDLPVLGPVEPLPALPLPALTDAELDRIVADLRDSETPPLTYRELSTRFRAAGHSASETRLRSSWRRVVEVAAEA